MYKGSSFNRVFVKSMYFCFIVVLFMNIIQVKACYKTYCTTEIYKKPKLYEIDDLFYKYFILKNNFYSC